MRSVSPRRRPSNRRPSRCPVDRFPQRVRRHHQPGLPPPLRRQRQPSLGHHLVQLFPLADLQDVGTQLRERGLDVSGRRRHHRGQGLRVALAHDVAHVRGLHAGLLQLRERLARLHPVQLPRVAHQRRRGIANRVAIFSRSRICRVEIIELVHGQDRRSTPRIAARPLSVKSPRAKPALRARNRCRVSALIPVSAPGRRRRGRRADRRRDTLVGQHIDGAAQHGGLAGPGQALDADEAAREAAIVAAASHDPRSAATRTTPPAPPARSSRAPAPWPLRIRAMVSCSRARASGSWRVPIRSRASGVASVSARLAFRVRT